MFGLFNWYTLFGYCVYLYNQSGVHPRFWLLVLIICSKREFSSTYFVGNINFIGVALFIKVGYTRGLDYLASNFSIFIIDNFHLVTEGFLEVLHLIYTNNQQNRAEYNEEQRCKTGVPKLQNYHTILFEVDSLGCLYQPGSFIG